MIIRVILIGIGVLAAFALVALILSCLEPRYLKYRPPSIL